MQEFAWLRGQGGSLQEQHILCAKATPVVTGPGRRLLAGLLTMPFPRPLPR